jgi:putative spermidine/putrescine transport system substrate-binding protein
MKWGAALGAAAALPSVGGFRGYTALAQDDAVWETEPDMGLAAEQAQEIVSYGMPDDWANYGEVFKNFQASLGVTNGTHVDTDMSSLEEITKFDAEKANPVAMFADIGMLYGQIASQRGVVRKGIKARPVVGLPHLPVSRRLSSTSTLSAAPRFHRAGLISCVRISRAR